MQRKPERPDPPAKIGFWPTKYQAVGCFSGLAGAILGVVLLFLTLAALEWLDPGSTEDTLFFVLLAMPLSAALGMAAGIKIANRRFSPPK